MENTVIKQAHEAMKTLEKPSPLRAEMCIRDRDSYSEEKIQQMCDDVKTVKDAGAETVFVMVHFGVEYASTPDENQKAVVDKLFEAGADVILGSHPHVLQPLEVRTITDEDGTQRKGVVIYSLGNFLSSQYYTADSPYDTDIGLIMDVALEKTGAGRPEITGISLEPVSYTHLGMLNGPSIENTKELQSKAGNIQIIMSGGITKLSDLEAVSTTGVHGVIIGSSLYEGKMDLSEAISIYERGI